MAGSHPRMADTDNDGLIDGLDVNPIKWDNDEDGLSDYEEWLLGTDPNATDSDQDGLTDGQEVKGWGFQTNPLAQDTDQDFISDSAEMMTYKYEIDTKKEMNQPVSLTFDTHCIQPSAAQLAFSLVYGEYAVSNTTSDTYGIANITSLEIEIVKAEQNLRLFNITTNSTQRYISHVVDLVDAISQLNLTETFDYHGTYLMMINDTEAGCTLEQFELEVAKYLDPNIPDFDGDNLMDGVETQGLVAGVDTIDFKDSYWYDNLTIDNSTSAYDEFYLEIPSIGRVVDANVTILLETDGKPQGPYEESVLGSVEVMLIKEELNCSLEDATLFDETFNIYNNWTIQDAYAIEEPYLPIEIDLGDALANEDISEFYGSYYLRIDINTNAYYYANNTVNFTLAEYKIQTDTWVYPQGLNQFSWYTDPALKDSDRDGWNDHYEIFTTHTNPLSEDTDGDGSKDSDDYDPLQDLIIEIWFRDGDHNNLDSNTDEEDPTLQAIIEFETFNQELCFITPPEKSDEGDADFGQKYYFNVEDSRSLQPVELKFYGELWHIYPTDDEGNHLGDIRLLRDSHHYVITDGTEDETFEQEGKLGEDNELDITFTTIGLEKANTIAIYEANTTFTGHYQQKERYNVIQLWVSDNNASTPFNKGPNSIVISTSLFANTKLNDLLLQDKISQTPLYAYGDDFQVIAADRDEDAVLEGSTNDVDFVIIRMDISASDAMEVLDLLLTCIINETLDETNETIRVEEKLYTYISTKFNETKAIQMNFPVGVLEYIPCYNPYQNSPQGKRPSAQSNLALNLYDLYGKWVENPLSYNPFDYYMALWDDVMLLYSLSPKAQEVLAFIVAIITFLVQVILTWLGPLLWVIFWALFMILVYYLVAMILIETIPIFIGVALGLSVAEKFTDWNFDWDICLVVPYDKDTKIGFFELEVDNTNIQMESWIVWEKIYSLEVLDIEIPDYVSLDLCIPEVDNRFDISNLLGEKPSNDVKPALSGGGFSEIANASMINFYIAYLDDDNPEYLNLTLVAPCGETFEYEMQEYSGEEPLREDIVQPNGVDYNITIDFENDFSGINTYGQWFYYVEGEDADENEAIWPSTREQSVYQPGPFIGHKEWFLYRPSVNISENIMWDNMYVNFTVSGIRDIAENNPENVSLHILYPNGNLQSYEMGIVSSYAYDNVANWSFYYNKTVITYSSNLNFSNYYDFTEDAEIFYYYNATFSDGNQSVYWNEGDWYEIGILTFSSFQNGAPKILGYAAPPRRTNHFHTLPYQPLHGLLDSTLQTYFQGSYYR